ncbi:hypothetical protein B0H14DRAFT_2632702 [Mycena olivaceomarginata]|nr:hypothetical protein B0H14DRAFT_2632702 [Mycena olivaceomarginata]
MHVSCVVARILLPERFDRITSRQHPPPEHPLRSRPPPLQNSDHEELMAVLATVNDLVVRSVQLTRVAQRLQKSVPELIARLHEQEAADHTWVRVVAKTPAEVEAEHAAAPPGSRAWWVVFIGREPGLYTTIEEADKQIKGCPNQQYRRKHDKKEALMAYAQRWQDGGVEKWVELTED